MRVCRHCGSRAGEVRVGYARMWLCRDCFTRFFERKVRRTLEKYRMLKGVSRLAVAVSGGKDSAALLAALARLELGIELAPIHLNLGIPGYSSECERKARELAEHLGLRLQVFKLEEEGFTVGMLGETRLRRRACAACSTVRRYWLNRLARELDAQAVATGHNLDDTVEVLFNAYFTGDLETIARLKPALPARGKLVARIKPLIALTEEEALEYAEILELPFTSVKCPLGKGSRSLRRKKLIETIAEEVPGYKHTFLSAHLRVFQPMAEEHAELGELGECRLCGEPSSQEVCGYCRVKSAVRAYLAS
ncbi:MAG: hypothetical protein DRN96_02595 [Thermoproteota archaeon]|nr:MAG: hypothetical protein DRN96_02595 [Candidatus Korarchaeota archaeon]